MKEYLALMRHVKEHGIKSPFKRDFSVLGIEFKNMTLSFVFRKLFPSKSVGFCKKVKVF